MGKEMAAIDNTFDDIAELESDSKDENARVIDNSDKAQK